MKKALIILITSFFSLSGKAQTYTQDSWTKYCGWHYSSSAPSWGGWVREPAGDNTGFYLLDTLNMQLDTVKLNNLYNTLALVDTAVDILELDGGLISAKDTSKVNWFMNQIASDSAQLWKKIVYEQCVKLAQLPNSINRMYYQLGNEITSPAYSRTFRYWQGQPYSNGIYFDQFIIP